MGLAVRTSVEQASPEVTNIDSRLVEDEARVTHSPPPPYLHLCRQKQSTVALITCHNPFTPPLLQTPAPLPLIASWSTGKINADSTSSSVTDSIPTAGVHVPPCRSLTTVAPPPRAFVSSPAEAIGKMFYLRRWKEATKCGKRGKGEGGREGSPAPG